MTAQRRGRIVISETPFDPGQVVEVVVLSKEKDAATSESHSVQSVLASGIAGMWNDRTDIGDSLEYARELRKRSEQRMR